MSNSLKAYVMFEQALDIETMRWVFTARTNFGIDDYADGAQHLVYVCRWVKDEQHPDSIDTKWLRYDGEGAAHPVTSWTSDSLDAQLEKYLAAQEQEEQSFLTDVLTTAVEGGINDWSETSEYTWSSEEPYALVHELDDDGNAPSGNCYGWGLPEGEHKCEGHRITLEIIKKGIEVCRITSQANYTGHRIKEAVAEQDAGEIDSIGADIIVQFGLFGELIYG